MADDWIELGRISGVFGIKGWLKVFSHTRPRQAILDYPKWYLGRGQDRQQYTVCEGRRQGPAVVVRLEGLTDRSEAESLVGSSIVVTAEQLEPAREGEFFWRDLIGLEVVTLAGETLGEVVEMMETGANDVLVIKGDRRRLVPFTRDAVVDVDKAGGTIRVDWDPAF